MVATSGEEIASDGGTGHSNVIRILDSRADVIKDVSEPMQKHTSENQVTDSMEGEVPKTLSPNEIGPGDVGVNPEGKGGEVRANDMGLMEGQNSGESLSEDLGAVLEGLSGNGIISDKGKNEQQGMHKDGISQRQAAPSKPYGVKVVPIGVGSKISTSVKPTVGSKPIRGILKTTNKYFALGTDEGGGNRAGSSTVQ
ncbi:hypothetical protein L6452_37120 [Arctium lappa]|uniref:Uncharacterized protein n=1 Tax=Arctium lappa TaxID=4217 RepID=A0ACB8Y6A3_ARCLA|nr:hypothetical protein L6452_37120 [Arctium lappa]